MPADKVQVLGQQPGEKESHKRVVCEDTSGTLLNGMALCYNRDYTGDGADEVDWGRAARTEKPAIDNLAWFAGLATGLPSAGKVLSATATRLTIVDGRVGQVCLAYCAAATYTHNQELYLQADSYTISATPSAILIGVSLQAVTLSSAGTLQILLYGGN